MTMVDDRTQCSQVKTLTFVAGVIKIEKVSPETSTNQPTDRPRPNPACFKRNRFRVTDGIGWPGVICQGFARLLACLVGCQHQPGLRQLLCNVRSRFALRFLFLAISAIDGTTPGSPEGRVIAVRGWSRADQETARGSPGVASLPLAATAASVKVTPKVYETMSEFPFHLNVLCDGHGSGGAAPVAGYVRANRRSRRFFGTSFSPDLRCL